MKRLGLKSSFILYPNTEEGADRLVVAGLQLHVTPVFKLVDVFSSPKDSVTPGRHAALPTAEKKTTIISDKLAL